MEGIKAGLDIPKVTIILPVYNVRDYISDCIESIINQTCKDFELLVVDDGTKDDSIFIAESLLSSSDIRYTIIHRKNGGLSAARNTGIKAAQGKFLCFVDSDDVIHPEYIETLLNDIEANDVPMAIGNFKWVTEKGKKDFDLSDTHGVVVDKKDFLCKILRRQIFNYFGCFMISRSYIIEHNLLFDENVFFGVDQAYMWYLMVGVPKYTYSKKVVYNYFNRPGSIMTATKVDKMLSGLPSLKKCSDDLKENPYFHSESIYTRWKISALHTVARNFDYNIFCKALPKFDLHARECLKYPHWKIKFIAVPVALGKISLYEVLRRF